MKTILRAALLGSVMTFAVLAPATAQPAATAASDGTLLALSAHGEVKVTPDMATVVTGVATTAPTAAEAMRLNREKMNAALAALRALGVESKDVQTTGISLQPIYRTGGISSGGRRPIEGYRATNQVRITFTDLERVGPVVDAMIAAGGNEISSVTLGVRDPAPAQDAARREAVRRLKAKADLYADATGQRLSRLRSLSEGAAWQSDSRLAGFRAGNFAEPEAVFGAIDPRTPFEPGQMTVRVDVQGIYELE